MFHASEIKIPQSRGEVVFQQAGLQAGPALAVFGRPEQMQVIADRMARVPSLAYMRGSITIYATEDDSGATHVPDVDDVLVLMDRSEAETHNPQAALYWKVLARAAALGIIAGRGVPMGPTRVTWH